MKLTDKILKLLYKYDIGVVGGGRYHKPVKIQRKVQQDALVKVNRIKEISIRV